MAIIRTNGRKKKSTRKKSTRKASTRRKTTAKKSTRRKTTSVSRKRVGSYPKKAGRFSVQVTKKNGRKVFIISGFAKKKNKVMYDEKKVAEWMKARAKEEKGAPKPKRRAASKKRAPTKRKRTTARRSSKKKRARKNPMSDEQFIASMLRNPLDDFDMEEIVFEEDYEF